MLTIREYIDQSEKEREEGKLSEALISIDNAIVLAGTEAHYVELLEAMAHKLEVWKFFYTKTKQEVFWELLKGDAETGLQIADAYHIEGHPRAVMLLRRGTYNMFRKDYVGAVEWFAQAYKALPEGEKAGTRAEYLGHLGEAEGCAGIAEGVPHLEQALAEVEVATDMRPFHKLVIQSGVHLRLAAVYIHQEDLGHAKEQWGLALPKAEILAHEFQMSARLEQCKQMAVLYKFS